MRAAENVRLVRHPSLSLLLHDAGRTLEEAVDAYRILGRLGKPVVNVESFGGRGNGYVDLPPSRAPEAPAEASGAPAAYRLPFASWTRVYGAWQEEDYVDGNGKPCAGIRSYRELIRYVAADRERHSHLMIHVGGWFQGASRVERAEQTGDWRIEGCWTNTFHPGADGSGGAGRYGRPAGHTLVARGGGGRIVTECGGGEGKFVDG